MRRQSDEVTRLLFDEAEAALLEFQTHLHQVVARDR